MKATKKQLLEAIAQSDGFLQPVADRFNMTRQAVSKRVAADVDLQEAVREAEDKLLDIAQSELAKAIRAGDFRAIKFLLATKGKRLGYTTGSEIQLDGKLGVGEVSILHLPDNGRDVGKPH